MIAFVAVILVLQIAGVLSEAPRAVAAAAPAASTPVEVVLYSDFQCPFCAQLAGPFRQLQTKGIEGMKVSVQFKHFPLAALHPAALLAHQAAQAAKEQNRFWEMHDLLFTNQRRATRADLLAYAKQLGLDMPRFERDMDSDRVKKLIAADVAEGEKLRVAGTPTFTINGKAYSGTRSFDDLKGLIIAQLRRGAASAATARPASVGATVTRAGAGTTAPTPATGPEGAVDLVLYSDFQCPFCQRFAEPFRTLQEQGVEGMKVNVTFKHFPLSIHPAAPLAHQASLAAKAQGKFWEIHDLLFENQTRAMRADLLGYAKKLGLNLARFEKDMDSEAVKQAIAADMAEGNAAGVTGTPSYTINGKMYSGTRPLDQLEQLIAGERRRARAMAEVSENAMSKGPATAPVTLELFLDLQSPVSVPTVEVINQLLERYPTAVRLQFRNFPLAFHPQAPLAHEAAMTAARSGRFWEFTEFILRKQNSLREQDLIAHAGAVGLDATAFAATLQEHRYAPRVDADVTAALNRGVRGSPSILINGTKIDGVPSLQALTQQVEAALTAIKEGKPPAAILPATSQSPSGQRP